MPRRHLRSVQPRFKMALVHTEDGTMCEAAGKRCMVDPFTGKEKRETVSFITLGDSFNAAAEEAQRFAAASTPPIQLTKVMTKKCHAVVWPVSKGQGHTALASMRDVDHGAVYMCTFRALTSVGGDGEKGASSKGTEYVVYIGEASMSAAARLLEAHMADIADGEFKACEPMTTKHTKLTELVIASRKVVSSGDEDEDEGDDEGDDGGDDDDDGDDDGDPAAEAEAAAAATAVDDDADMGAVNGDDEASSSDEETAVGVAATAPRSLNVMSTIAE